MDGKRQGGKLKKGDLILFLGVLVLCGAIWTAVHFLSPKGKTVVVTDGTHTKVVLSLEVATERRFYSEGGWNVVRIRDGKVSITAADCPQQVCVHHSPIDTAGEAIICLPHKLTVEVQ